MRVPLPSLLGAVGLLLVVGLTALSYVQSSAILSGVESLRDSSSGLPASLEIRTVKDMETGTFYKHDALGNVIVEMNWTWDGTEEDWARILRDWAFICANLPPG